MSGKFGKLCLGVSPTSTSGEGTPGSPTNAPQLQEWEKGQMDYLGKDSYQKIEEHIDTVLNGNGITEEVTICKVPPVTKDVPFCPVRFLAPPFTGTLWSRRRYQIELTEAKLSCGQKSHSLFMCGTCTGNRLWIIMNVDNFFWFREVCLFVCLFPFIHTVW